MISKILKHLFGEKPTSAHLSLSLARKIVAKFGNLVEELNDPKRYTLEDLENKRPFALPLKRLPYTKEQVQTALAVVIADLVFLKACDPLARHSNLLYAAISSSGDLAYLTDRETSGWCYTGMRLNSEEAFSLWRARCEDICKRLSAQNADSLPSEQDIHRYLRSIDSMLPHFLNEPALVAVRGT